MVTTFKKASHLEGLLLLTMVKNIERKGGHHELGPGCG